jgi:hypothetical protein
MTNGLFRLDGRVAVVTGCTKAARTAMTPGPAGRYR